MEREPVNESFVFHAEWINDLPQRFREKFSMLAINYAIYGIEPEIDEDSLEFSEWIKIKRRIDSDKNAYKEVCEKRAEAGRRGGFAKGKNNGSENKNAENSNAKNNENENSKNSNAKKEIAKIANANFAKNKIAKIAEYDSEYDSEYESDTEFDSDSHTDSEFVSHGDEKSVCESQEIGIDKAIRDKESVFLELWDASPQIFGIRTTGILRPKQYHEYFKSDFVTESYIRQGMRNFVNAVKDGSLEACYIPKTFENFILNNTLARYQEPRGKKTNAEAVKTAEKYMPKKRELDVSAIPENWAEAD